MNGSTQKSVTRRKRTRFYEIYLSKLLKQVSEDNGITSNSKQQLNSVLCLISRLLATKVNDLTEIAKKKTISEKEVNNAINVLFPAELARGMNTMSEQAVENYELENLTKGVTRQQKAGIIFPPSVTEKYLRNFGYSKIMISNRAPVALAAAVEYLAGEILDNAALSAKQKKRVRITIRDLEIGVRTDKDINIFFESNNISFLGGGVIPFIHPRLLVKRTRRRKPRQVGVKKPHRYRPGTVSIREIRRFQKTSNCLTLAKFPFEKFVRSIIRELYQGEGTLKISKEVFTSLQYFIEQEIVSLLRKANLAAIHAGRVKIISSDIELVHAMEHDSTKSNISQPLAVEGVNPGTLDLITAAFDVADLNHDGKLSLSEFTKWHNGQSVLN